jgi:hypothetical protein
MEEKILTLVGGIPRLVVKKPNLISNEKKEKLRKLQEKHEKLELLAKKEEKKKKKIYFKPFDKEKPVKRRLKTGKSLSLPRNKYYKGEELKIELNGYPLEYMYDYQYVGDNPKNKVSFTFDLEKGDILRFIVE